MNHQWLAFILMVLSFGVGWMSCDMRHMIAELRRDNGGDA
jgi:hypothetical protein